MQCEPIQHRIPRRLDVLLVTEPQERCLVALEPVPV